MGETKTEATNRINLYAVKLSENKDLKEKKITAEDGDILSVFADSAGGIVGFIDKDNKGRIRGVSLEEKDGRHLYADTNKDGNIDSETITKEDKSLDGQELGTLASSLEGNKDFKIGNTLTAGDGGHICIYTDSKGITVGSVNKDPDGKIRNVAFERGNESFSYNDMNNDGKSDHCSVSAKATKLTS